MEVIFPGLFHQNQIKCSTEFQQNNEILDNQSMVIFTILSPTRTFPVIICGTIFYVNREVIKEQCPELDKAFEEYLESPQVFATISPNNFLVLLKVLCPCRNGTHPEPIRGEVLPVLFAISRRLRLFSLMDRCKFFVMTRDIFNTSIHDLFRVYNVVSALKIDEDGQLRSHILAAAFIEKNLEKVYDLMLAEMRGDSLYDADWIMVYYRVKKLKHKTAHFISNTPRKCGCSNAVATEMSASKRLYERRNAEAKAVTYSGINCTVCHSITCASCSNELCPELIVKIVLEMDGDRAKAPPPPPAPINPNPPPMFGPVVPETFQPMPIPAPMPMAQPIQAMPTFPSPFYPTPFPSAPILRAPISAFPAPVRIPGPAYCLPIVRPMAPTFPVHYQFAPPVMPRM